MALFTKQEALDYHSKGRRGKVEVVPVKPCNTQKDLSMAYSPGVAEACKEIAEDKEKSYLYTGRGNLVAVVSNGTAVLGLGNIGPEAGKPVMEGKGVLFKVFADVDVYDINLDVTDPDELCNIVKALEPTFGGINLEDIKAPECFYIEEKLKKEMNIPVFHDDQHGTAIISGAGLINAAEITGKKIEDMRLVVSGAGAAAIACTNFYMALGIKRENVAMFDSRGHINKSREGLNEQKLQFATDKEYKDLADAMNGADLFLGLSVKGMVTKEMVKSMADSPIIFACANPDPEISYTDAKEARPDAIMGTGRSDFPNQVNNVLGFPFIFRGALDVNASAINEEMKIAAATALAALAKEPAPDYVCEAYGVDKLEYGIDYIIPKPLDLRLIEWESAAVAQAAMDTGVARKKIDIEEYKKELRERLAASRKRVGEFLDTYDLDI
ncbi:malic enzyme-like NAD(P)-binding protein [Maridesulfovibrio salexigens]|uniref:Malate dehydrogenase (Oxaloacetate-decarboxylating) (NADP(+)) n=1 Tax=Maridesulfovibrio salexigens (strain ATCC 14822 / DSM 2638 / NCIMB 8403 / VKM B-1763) TaxID=526222 RepID=C6BYK0_MARSD|nr:malic enzyme-like NAD(P)-binding protein [Maridesulfovibrio salexigens]ACS78791.1 Malate dehydrogenase (oxaloacetate-decarboxylating) (NADP(+)) [Maridesulfovibrio salexigens DSM 2638]